MTNLDARAVATMIDHTILSPEASPHDVARLCAEANELRVAAICISPSLLPIPNGWLDAGIAIAAVCGFPSGAHVAEVKAEEARRAVGAGATEIDMVINLGAACSGDWNVVHREMAAVRAAVGASVTLKVIVESAVLDSEQLVRACEEAERAGADFVKTSTGFHPAGGATVEAVRQMAVTVGGRLGVKASGGIRTAADAVAMINAGATRLGTSRTRDILGGLSG